MDKILAWYNLSHGSIEHVKSWTPQYRKKMIEWICKTMLSFPLQKENCRSVVSSGLCVLSSIFALVNSSVWLTAAFQLPCFSQRPYGYQLSPCPPSMNTSQSLHSAQGPLLLESHWRPVKNGGFPFEVDDIKIQHSLWSVISPSPARILDLY